MKQILRSLFLLLLAVVWGGNGFAVEKTYSYTFVKGGTFTTESETKTFNSIAWTIVSDGGYFAFNTSNSAQQIGSQKKPSKSTIISTSDLASTIKKIEITGWNTSGESTSTEVVVGGVSYGTKSFTANKASYVYDGTSSGKIEIKIINTAKAYYIQTISVTYEEGPTKTATTLTFPTDGVTITEGDEASFTLPTPTLKAGDTELTGKAFTYTTDNDAMFEAYEAANGPAKLVAGKFGTATITATYAGDDTYQGSSAKYTVTYKAAPKPTLTFSETEVNVTYGDEASFTAPTLSFKDADGNDIATGEVVYTFADGASTNVVTINEKTGTITAWNKPGTTTIAAMADYNGTTYDASYTLNYKKAQPTFAFTEATITGNVGETLACPAYTLKAGDKDIVPASGDIVFESKAESVATVDMETGELTFEGEGTTTITAVFGNDYYESTTATYSVEVTDPNKVTGTATFNFREPANYGYGVSTSSNHSGDLDDNGGTIVDKTTNVVITCTTTSSNPNRFWSDGLRLYADATLTVSIPGGKITEVTATGITGNVAWTYNVDGTASATYSSVLSSKNRTLTDMTITYTTFKKVALDETSNNNEILVNNENKVVNASLTRTLKANVWNTFCVPFDITLAGSALEGASVSKVKSVDEATSTIYFEAETDKIEAGKAYLVKPEAAIENPTFDAVTIQNVTPANTTGNDNYKFVGTYSPKTVSAEEYGTIFGVNDANKLAKIKANTTMNGIRAYFVIPAEAAAKLNFDGETTGISTIDSDNAAATGRVYNLQGQYVGTSLDGLAKGVYVVNGKKVAK